MAFRACPDCGADMGHRPTHARRCLACAEARLKTLARIRLKHPELARKRTKTPDERWKYLALRYVKVGIELGVLPKLNGTVRCVDCGDVATDYEHRDYFRPLDVEPVCHGCNVRRGSAKAPTYKAA